MSDKVKSLYLEIAKFIKQSIKKKKKIFFYIIHILVVENKLI